MSDAAAAADAAVDNNAADDAAAQAAAADAGKGKPNGKDDAVATTAADPDSGEGKVIWPENWREQIAGEDEKKLARLGRFAEPGKIFDSFLEVETKYKSADIRTPFPDEGSDKDKAAWRKKNNVPDEPSGYFEGLPDGLVVGDEDKPGLTLLAEAMHARHAPPDVVHTAMDVYYKQVEAAIAAQAEQDAQAKKDTDDALHELYGGDFRRNINDLNAWLGDEVKDKVLSARTPDGTPLGSDPDFIKFMVAQMRALNPLVTVPGLGGSDPAAALDDEITAIEKTMKTDYKAYQADEAMQARYLTLLEARDKRA